MEWVIESWNVIGSFWSNINWSKVAEIATIIGAGSAITGIIMFAWEFRKRKISNGRKTLIFHDFLRHLFINTAIVDLVRYRIEAAGGYDKFYPEEGVFERMKFLPEDFRLSRFRSSDACFDKMHDLELLMRNYGVSLDVANKHLSHPTLPEKYKKQALDDLDKRAKSLIINIYCLAKDLKLDKMQPLQQIISERYGKDISAFNSKYNITEFSPYLISKAKKKELDMALFDAKQLEELYNKYFAFRRDEGYVRLIEFPHRKPYQTRKKKPLPKE